MVELVISGLALALVAFPLWTIVRFISLGRKNDALARKLQDLELEVALLRSERNRSAPATPPASAAAVPQALKDPPPPVTPPPVSAIPPPHAASALPPPLPSDPPAPPPLAAAGEAPARRIDWEQFMGAKLFAWLGGLAAFLGAAFFVKYSFEHDLIPAEVRVALGFLLGLGLIIGGLKTPRARYAVTAQTLIATGVVILYAVTFACGSIYRFPFFGPTATFLLMALITGAAFLLAVRLSARVIAVLGLLGGFLTPVLLSTGRDNPAGLFGYIALLDAGLLAVALRRRWSFLFPLGAAATALMQIGWADTFLTPHKAVTATLVCALFSGLFLGGFLLARRFGWGERDDARERELSGEPVAVVVGAILLPLVALGFALYFIVTPAIAFRSGLLFTHLALAEAPLLTIAFARRDCRWIQGAAGGTVFVLLSLWMGLALTASLAPWALAAALGFGAVHTAFPLALERRFGAEERSVWSQLAPLVALLTVLIPIVKFEAVSPLFWPGVLAIDALAVLATVMTGSLVALAGALTLTVVATALWILRAPVHALPSSFPLVVVGGFAALFFLASLWVARRLAGTVTNERRGLWGDRRTQLPAFSVLLPFALLVLMSQRLPLANPGPVFGLGLLLVLLALGLSALMRAGWLPACALAGLAALEYVWQAQHFSPRLAVAPLAWHVGFTALFTLFPFAFRSRFAAETGPWAASALAAMIHFPLVHRAIGAAWPNDQMGLVPLAFALPMLASFAAVVRHGVSTRPALNQAAWLGGATLLFITLIFPIQFERQWLTITWAVEGAALLWLFRRVPHEGLRAAAVALLLIAFARLGLNPAALSYHAPAQTPIFNGWLYTYGVTIAALFAGANLARTPAHRVFNVPTSGVLGALGTALLFLLLNIEIADYFATPGQVTLTFTFSGHFARDMTYTIAWSVFALGLLLVSLRHRLRAGRYAALALLAAAVIKLFFHDLARLEALYRVGALFAVAAIAILASFAYQRSLPGHDQNK